MQLMGIVYVLIYSCSVIAIDDDYAKKLVSAIENENLELIDEIINERNINEIENLLVLDTPIIFFAATCYPVSLRHLIKLEMDINVLHAGSSLRPISLAAISDGMECYDILKEEGALKSLKFKEQYELMNSSIMIRNQRVIDDLINLGFNYLDDRFGVSSIEYAIYNDRSWPICSAYKK